MSKVNFSRLLWQIPVLILVVAAIMPDVSWHSSSFGYWPVWLLSMPLFAFFRIRALNRKSLQHEMPIKNAQVLVFNQKKRLSKITLQKIRRAA